MSRYLLFTGPRRDVTGWDMKAALGPFRDSGAVLVAGAAIGADRMAAAVWRGWGLEVEEHPVSPAEWAARPGLAGHDRNARMVARVAGTRGVRAVAVIVACPGDKPGCQPQPHGTHGTANCAGLAEAAAIPVYRYHPDSRRWEHPRHT